MQIFPAIDLKNGQCVRLFQGDFSKQTVVNEDPIAQAKAFASDGATYLHIVDLDGALEGRPVNLEIIKKMQTVAKIPVQVGGGIRSMAQVDYYLESGIDRVIIGSAALTDPDFLRAAVQKYGSKIAAGIDAKNGFVATSGWLDVSQVSYLDLAKRMEEMDVETIIYTDISRDGTLTGPNLEQMAALQKHVSINLVASGGVSSRADLEALAKLGLYGAIAGKALYNGNISMSDVVEVEQHAY
ncbi:1-(5-phosphoribosyl)-5-[(5-phosphoribosylamino)methylideneamino]imidazole-4-carboxamide isomerase [Listeria cossartiae subsp. cayugensis]|uniref:1-(5-phosphoribosyl)-5-[(5-phosphoribosylamino)methylideneamino] imidazole-4-carboxamide isomerase n=1 Tax=Listeria cossartiae subsp. cayugensis TaxID=2713505 RepID=A0ABU2IMN1_9LIST|nr:1-(5-phosphoribosyl)-5-[(5-phosphoribosylamino)methylideneamino]imidazole-4-carboxamide isomerase [Listeria cossartiae]MDT0049182.1 1-(5-phosphoribosyl)-5-[(5-phosphoribosylamino)methylideneamino]imidazole-4-carboxamide isomerase [Listeria cossartiae subsp. cayugensis]MDT0065685.1 1-(5-phosphoribosyl)-5-[(5-phosphoribosylamino)methylideneamino]imidazole-4-carboxamide isomerase [Listeria cossartiae subsp. cayugensis]MDT0078711.1 1-(5-phosphoribosyl)-5-[(5-phosphoribosylamino)methylideneamino]i